MSDIMRRFLIFVDESARPNPGPAGGVAIIKSYPAITGGQSIENVLFDSFDLEKKIQVFDPKDQHVLVVKINPKSTQNRAAIFTTIAALDYCGKLTNDQVQCLFVYDSAYMSEMFTEGRLITWIKNDWKNPKTKKYPENVDLLKRLYATVLRLRLRMSDELRKTISTITAYHIMGHTKGKDVASQMNALADGLCIKVSQYSILDYMGIQLTMDQNVDNANGNMMYNDSIKYNLIPQNWDISQVHGSK
jgi:ribonuclease HI